MTPAIAANTIPDTRNIRPVTPTPNSATAPIRRIAAARVFRSISFPDVIHAGIRVARLGNSSVRYELALYRNDDQLPCATGHFVHVYVERSSNRSVPVPVPARDVLATITRIPAGS